MVHDSYWIQLPASYTKRDCQRAVSEVRRYALSAGYHSENWQVRGERLALFQRNDMSIDVLRRDNICRIKVSSGGYSDRTSALIR